MFNRARFCFFDHLNEAGFTCPNPRRLPSCLQDPVGELLEATLCTDDVWRVLDCSVLAQLEFDKN